MANPYRALLLLLLPLVGGCPLPDDKDTSDTSDTSDTTDTDSGGDTDTAAPVSETGCYFLPTDITECPAPELVPVDQVTPDTCGAEVISVDGAGTPDENCANIGGMAPLSFCRYPITVIPPEEECAYGRPLVIDGAPRLAPLLRRDGWLAGPEAGPAAPAERAFAWARIGLAEHASIASFSRFALDLLQFGAPADLVADAHAAAADEVRHAKLAFGLAARGALGHVGPGPLDLRAMELSVDLVDLAEATAREGCIAETLSALMMAEAHDRSTDPAERAALAVIARDEARHAALAWRTVRWAAEAGGVPVREALARVFAETPAVPSDATGGLLAPDVARSVITRGWRDVIGPAAAALLADVESAATA